MHRCSFDDDDIAGLQREELRSALWTVWNRRWLALGVAWGVSLALVLSRRSLRQMRGVRPILALFAAMTASEITLLLCLSPRGSPQVHYAYQWAWGLYAALALSLAGVVAAIRFGGTPSQVSRQPVALPVAERSSLLH